MLRGGEEAALDWVVVQIRELLLNDGVAEAGFGVGAFLPDLVGIPGFVSYRKLPSSASRLTPLCWATSRRMAFSVPMRSGWVIRHREALVARQLRLENDVA